MYYKFCSLSNCLRPASAQALAALSGQAAGSARFVYRPLLSVDNPLAAPASLDFSDHGHEKVPKAFEGWEKWKSWQDVPDHLIAKRSELDPHNTIYRSPQYIKIRKLQYWMQKPDGIPIHFKMGTRDYALFYTTIALVTVSLSWGAYLHYELSFK